jgi:VanZ family protein
MPINVADSARATIFLRTLWLAAIVIVVVGSLLPAYSTPIRTLAELHINDKFEHFGAYAALAFLPAIHERRRFIIVAAIGTVLLGIALEFGQLFTGWRDFEIGDMLADAVGVCFGVAAAIPVRSSGILRSLQLAENHRRDDGGRAVSSPNTN